MSSTQPRQGWWRPGRTKAPGVAENRQLERCLDLPPAAASVDQRVLQRPPEWGARPGGGPAGAGVTGIGVAAVSRGAPPQVGVGGRGEAQGRGMGGSSGSLCCPAALVEDLLLKRAEEEPESFDNRYIVAASFEDSGNHTTVTALFNNQAYHSPAVALALVDNVLFKLLSGTRASITAVNHPQPQSAVEALEDILYQYVPPPPPSKASPLPVESLATCFFFAPRGA